MDDLLISLYNRFMDKMLKPDGFENQYLFVLQGETLNPYREAPLLFPLRITDIGYFPNASYHYRLRDQGCPEGILLLCVAGSGYYKLHNQKVHELKAGQAVVLPPNTPHEYGASKHSPWSVHWFHFSGPASQAFSQSLATHSPIAVESVDVKCAVQLMRRCYEILKSPCGQDELLAVCQYASSILAMLNLAAKQMALPISEKGNRAIGQAIAFMKRNINRSLTLAQIAAAANFSASHLHALFKTATGQSPVAYFTHMKIQAAGKELYFTNRPVKEIAADFGFFDSCYFSRRFKKVMGKTPLEYRDMTKG